MGSTRAQRQVIKLRRRRSHHPDGSFVEIGLVAWPQVVSDFGFFGRKKAEQFLASFEDTYYLKQTRISGDSVRCAPAVRPKTACM